MEVNVGNQSWVHRPMQLAKCHRTKKYIHEEYIQECKTLHTWSSDTIGKSFMQQCNEQTVTLTCPAPPELMRLCLVRG